MRTILNEDFFDDVESTELVDDNVESSQATNARAVLYVISINSNVQDANDKCIAEVPSFLRKLDYVFNKTEKCFISNAQNFEIYNQHIDAAIQNCDAVKTYQNGVVVHYPSHRYPYITTSFSLFFDFTIEHNVTLKEYLDLMKLINSISHMSKKFTISYIRIEDNLNNKKYELSASLYASIKNALERKEWKSFQTDSLYSQLVNNFAKDDIHPIQTFRHKYKIDDTYRTLSCLSTKDIPVQRQRKKIANLVCKDIDKLDLFCDYVSILGAKKLLLVNPITTRPNDSKEINGQELCDLIKKTNSTIIPFLFYAASTTKSMYAVYILSNTICEDNNEYDGVVIAELTNDQQLSRFKEVNISDFLTPLVLMGNSKKKLINLFKDLNEAEKEYIDECIDKNIAK